MATLEPALSDCHRSRAVRFFTITGEKRVPLPPLIPVVAQGEVGVLAGAFAGMMVVISAIVIATTLSRRRFDLLRMGRG